MSRARLCAAVAALSLVGGCAVKSYTFDWTPDAQDGARDTNVSDTSDGSRVDAADPGPEASIDAALDGATDAGLDAVDSALDALDETPVGDAGLDGADAVDAPGEAGTDAAHDVASDAISDGPDAPLTDAADVASPLDAFDGTTDAPVDVAGEAGFDAPAETSDATDVIDVSDASSTDGGCPAGAVLGSSGCEVPTPAVRRLSPLSGATVATRRPELRWVPPSGGDALAVRLCADRFCATTVRRDAVAGGSYTPPDALARGVYYWRLEPASATSTVPPTYAGTWQFSVTHVATTSSAGSWGSLPDYDGDGLADYAVGDAAANGGLGAVYLSRGVRGATVRYEPSVVVPRPPGAPSGFGAALASGDVNGDGYVDLLIGAPGTGTEVGAVYLQFGGPVARSILRLNGLSAGDRFGASLDAAGDSNGDGYAEVAVGAPGTNEARGSVAVFAGGPLLPAAPVVVNPGVSAPSLWVPGVGYGASVVFAGDVDGDLRSELIVGAPCALVSAITPLEGRGYVTVQLGATGVGTGPYTVVAAESYGLPANTRLGASSALAGDINADGMPDVLVGAPGVDLTLVLPGLGRAPGYRFEALPGLSIGNAGVGLGTAVGGGNDLNGDGFDDPIVAAPSAGSTGAILVFIGAAFPLSTFQQLSGLPGVTAGARFGASIAVLGDSNGDGLSELLIGAPGQLGGGAVFFQYGRAGIFDGRWEFTALAAPPAPTVQLGGAITR